MSFPVYLCEICSRHPGLPLGEILLAGAAEEQRQPAERWQAVHRVRRDQTMKN